MSIAENSQASLSLPSTVRRPLCSTTPGVIAVSTTMMSLATSGSWARKSSSSSVLGGRVLVGAVTRENRQDTQNATIGRVADRIRRLDEVRSRLYLPIQARPSAFVTMAEEDQYFVSDDFHSCQERGQDEAKPELSHDCRILVASIWVAVGRPATPADKLQFA